MTLLSGLVSLASTLAPALIKAAASSVTLTAKTEGVYVAVQPKASKGIAFALETTGPSTTHGQIGVVGKLYTPGFIAQGRTIGTIEVYTASGDLTLAVVGPLQTGYTGLPSELNFTITAGTGKFKGHFGGTGTIAITILSGYSGPQKTTDGSLTVNFTGI